MTSDPARTRVSREPPPQPTATQGLATLAVLKANFDQGHDHVEMFLPFVLEVITHLPKDDFDLQEIKDSLHAHLGLDCPSPHAAVPSNPSCQASLCKARIRSLLARP